MSRNVESIFGGVVPAPQQIPFSYTATGGETSISLPFYPITGVVTINGSVQISSDNFEIVDNSLNLGRALEAGDVVYALFDKILSPTDYQSGVRIYKFQAVGVETSFMPDFTAFGVQSLYIDGKFQVPGVDYIYDRSTGVVALLKSTPSAGVWVVAEMSVKQPNISPLFDRTIQEVGRSVNFSDNSIILSTDTVSVLDNKTVIYDVVNQKSWGKPSSVPNGAKIVSVTGSTLVYSPGSVSVSLVPVPGTATALANLLSSTLGTKQIGMPTTGKLSDILVWASPEQYGAIGDGTLHPLSERFSTLADAQAVYPFVTSLTQSIDWAACQKADNENKGIRPIRCPFYAKYHLGNNYLKLGERSKWYGNDSPNLDRECTMFIREGSVSTFGQDCIVRVSTAAEAGSSDEFVRGIVFKGFRLTRNRPRRYNSKYDKTIGFHADHALGTQVNISVNGCEYGFLGYVCWNLSGIVRIDSCHKGIWLDPATATPEYTPVAGAAMTAVNLRVEVDASVFGLVIRRAKYGKVCGWVEGMIVDSTVYPIYDSVNETAIAVTTYNCDSFDITELGIEAWQGVHHYNYGGSATINLSWTPDRALLNTTGKHGPYHAMSTLMQNTELFTLPATDNSMFYNLNVGSLTVRNLSGDFSNTTTYGSVYFLTTDQTSRIVFENCAVYFGANSPRFAPGWLGNVETIGGRYIVDAITPSGYTKIGPNYFVKTSWGTKAINAGDGRVQVAVGTDTPNNLKLHDVQAFVIASAATQPLAIALVSATDTAVSFQTAVNTTGYSINWKAYVSWTA